MRTLVVENLARIKKAVPRVSKRFKVKIAFLRPIGKISVFGKEVDEFVAEKVLEAVDFGFDVEDALLLDNKDYVLEFINIKSHSPRNNLKDVRARVIGTSGKAKKTIQELTGSVIVVNSNKVGIIVDSIHLDAAVQGIISIIQGAKHGNVFAHLEKHNFEKRKFDDEDLGLKEKFLKKS